MIILDLDQKSKIIVATNNTNINSVKEDLNNESEQNAKFTSQYVFNVVALQMSIQRI